MGTDPGEAIVVGVDGSDASLSVLRWAVGEAALRHRPLRVVLAFVRPVEVVGYGFTPTMWPEGAARADADRALSDFVAAAEHQAPDLRVSGAVVDGSPATVLIGESASAALLVVGARRTGIPAGLRLGSVSDQVATHARCPVVVVAVDHDPVLAARRPVVVGVDGSESANLAACFAFDEAERRNVGLVAVRAWTPPGRPWRSDVRPLVLDVAELETAERGLLVTDVDRWRSRYPAVRVEHRLVADQPARALLAVARQAQLLVVGSRGLSGFRGLLLGSVGRQVLHHARCPIMVVHPHHHLAAPRHGRHLEELGLR